MVRVNLPPGCAGFADGDKKFMAERGAGSFVNLEDGSPQLAKLRNQDYASAGLVDAGPEQYALSDKRANGRWCVACTRLWHSWSLVCSKCGRDTIPESEMIRPKVAIEDWQP